MGKNNCTYNNFTTERVLICLFMLEYYVPTIKYIKWSDNETVDALTMIP